MTSPLTITEHNILVLLREGETPVTIAPMLHISLSTEKFYTRLLYARLGAHNACHAVVKAIRAGWIKLED